MAFFSRKAHYFGVWVAIPKSKTLKSNLRYCSCRIPSSIKLPKKTPPRHQSPLKNSRQFPWLLFGISVYFQPGPCRWLSLSLVPKSHLIQTLCWFGCSYPTSPWSSSKWMYFTIGTIGEAILIQLMGVTKTRIRIPSFLTQKVVTSTAEISSHGL